MIEKSDGSQSEEAEIEEEETESISSEEQQEDDGEEEADDDEELDKQQVIPGATKLQSTSLFQEKLSQPLQDSKELLDELNTQLKESTQIRSTIDGQTNRDFANYEEYLAEICSHKQIINVDRKKKIEDPKTLEKSLRQGFIRKRKRKLNNISSYQIKIEHFFEGFLK